MNSRFNSLAFTIPVERGLQRLRELIVYISKQSESDPYFGATKLNKILYHADFRAFERFGLPLTGAEYFRLERGPAPKVLWHVRQDLVSEGALEISRVPLSNGYEQHRTIAKRDPVLSHFSLDEILLVNEVIDELRPQTAREVSDASHDVRWRVVGDKDSIPYEFAYLSDELPTQDDISRTKELAVKYGWE